MIVKFQVSDKSNGNKGSSTAMVNYLEKYDRVNEKESIKNGDLEIRRQGFFTHTEERLFKSEIIERIDTNKKGLEKNDSKFYSVTIAPSQKEQKQILSALGIKETNSVTNLSSKQLNDFEKSLIEYSRKCMTEYAKHFKRDGLEDGNQLVYAGIVEHYREFKGTEALVKSGNVKSGARKNGFQSHVHIIVSRKDSAMKIKLSPLANEKGNTTCKLNGKKVQRGFDRNLFNIKAERLFDQNYKYERSNQEKVEFRIEASKHELQKKIIQTERNPLKKKKLEEELIKRYDQRNNYSNKDKTPDTSLKRKKNINQIEI